MSSFGDSSLPVRRRGRRPGSGRTRCTRSCRASASRSCRRWCRSRSGCPPRPWPSSKCERLEPAAGTGASEVDVDARGHDVQVLGVRQVDEEAEDDQDVGPDQHRARAPRCPRRRRTGSRRRPTPATSRPGYSFRPSAMREACQRTSVDDDARDQRAGSGRPRRRWLPSKRRGRCTLRIANAVSTPTSTMHGEQVDQECEPALLGPSHGMRRSSFETTPISAMTIVGRSTMKPQKMNACMTPGTQALEQLALTEHDRRPRSGRARHVVEARHRFAHAARCR